MTEIKYSNQNTPSEQEQDPRLLYNNSRRLGKAMGPQRKCLNMNSNFPNVKLTYSLIVKHQHQNIIDLLLYANQPNTTVEYNDNKFMFDLR